MESVEVAPDFFDQGQALQQVPRQSLVNIARDEVKFKITKTIAMHLIWDLLLLAIMFTYWVKVKMTMAEKTSLLDPSVQTNMCQCWASVLLPFVVLKLLALAKHQTTPTIVYKRRYKLMAGVQMLAALAQIVCQAILY